MHTGYRYHNIQFEHKPTNFTQDPGDKNVYVPCPFGGPALPTWRIGNHYYTYSTLPEDFHQVAGGLIISSIESNMTGLDFQCYSPTGNGLAVFESSTGILTVQNSTTKDSKTLNKYYWSHPVT